MPPTVRAIGISHPGSPRHNRFIAMLEALGLPFELSPAVFIKGDVTSSPCYDHLARMKNLGYPMRAGEIGCFLAHRNVWQAAAVHDGCTLVLEDDSFVPPARLREILAAADVLAGKNMAARLFSRPRTAFRTWRELGTGVILVRPTRPGSGAVGYLITQEGARSLLRHSGSFWCPVDDYMNLEYLHGCIMLHFEPEIAEHRDGGVSLIGKRIKPPVSPSARVIRELLRAWRNARGSLHSKLTLLRLGLCFKRVRDQMAKSTY